MANEGNPSDPSTDFSTVEKIYKFLSPVDLSSQIKKYDISSRSLIDTELDFLMKYFVSGVKRAEEAIKLVKGSDNFKNAGVLYDSCYQPVGQPSQFLNGDYWKCEIIAPGAVSEAKPNTPSPPPQGTGTAQYKGESYPVPTPGPPGYHSQKTGEKLPPDAKSLAQNAWEKKIGTWTPVQSSNGVWYVAVTDLHNDNHTQPPKNGENAAPGKPNPPSEGPPAPDAVWHPGGSLWFPDDGKGSPSVPGADLPVSKPQAQQPSSAAKENTSTTTQTSSPNFKNLTNYYFEVCGGKKDATELVDFSINVLRTPYASTARSNTNEISLFLNYIPSTFASQMSPYFDVEFELPFSAETFKEQGTFASKPSLFRFLEGSVDLRRIPLTAADLSLVGVQRTSSALPKGNGSSGDNKDATGKFVSLFTGMELFTAPQTLMNMDKVGISQSRINEVKPFLPMASITGGSISIVNAGAGKFAHKKASLDLKIHDKNRLVEFSEIFRGPAGFGVKGLNCTVWLTYGWLAPRGRGEEDVYAKFINENMLVREAFQIINASYSFDVVGQVSAKLDMVSKGFSSIDKTSIGSADDNLLEKFKSLRTLIEKIKNERSSYANPPEGFNKEIRIFQILDSATSGDLEIKMEKKEFDAVIQGALEAVEKITDNNKKNTAKKLLEDIRELYGGDGYKAKIKTSANEFAKKSFALCASPSSPDPFLPLADKNKDPNAKLFSEELLSEIEISNKRNFTAMKDAKSVNLVDGAFIAFERKIVSFGKIFSTFCMPNLLQIAKNEGVDEIQVNFYLLNESCGPISLHSVAEFPIDIRILADQFSEFAISRGGENMTIQDFISFVAVSQFGDNRAPGYGMSNFYEPYSNEDKEPKPIEIKQENKKAGESGLSSDSQLDKNMSSWFAKYGSFKRPDIAIKIETLNEGSTDSKVDLLYKLQNSAADLYKNPQKTSGKRLIKKIHIYDKQLNPFPEMSQILRAEDGDGFEIYEGRTADQLTAAAKSITQSSTLANGARLAPGGNSQVSIDKQPNGETKVSIIPSQQITQTTDQKTKKTVDNSQSPVTPPPPVQTVGVPRRISGGRNILRDFISNTVPTINYGTNGTMVYNASVASKTDGLIGTINMQGGSFKAKSTLSPNGTAMADQNIPMRILPAQLTMTTAGCPLADLYQAFFIDFETGTTLDNMYLCSQIQHTFNPGKFQTNWTFLYQDGYAKFYGANSVMDYLKTFAKDK